MIGPLPYVGGKNRLANRIIRLFPEHKTYVEPFAGGAQVFFRKEPSPVEILNDLDREIVNFFRVCQRHSEELIRHLRFTIASREWFEQLAATSLENLTDVQRAARFFYLQKNSFGGHRTKRNFHYAIAQKSNFNPSRIPEILSRTHERLQRVQIECLPYEEVLRRYDRPSTLFYLDPPYWQRELYQFNFLEADFKALAEKLGRIRGKFILSLSAEAVVQQIFSRFHILKVPHSYTAQRKSKANYTELIVTNFKPRGGEM